MADYFDLQMRCPACIADGESGGACVQWFHAECGGKMQVGDDANYRCLACGKISHIKNWRYACETHEGVFRKTTNAHMANAMSTSGQITSIAGRKWLIRLLENLGSDW